MVGNRDLSERRIREKNMSRGRTNETDSGLMDRARSLHHSINVEESFSAGDVLQYEATLRELEKRGYQVTTTLAFSKGESYPIF